MSSFPPASEENSRNTWNASGPRAPHICLNRIGTGPIPPGVFDSSSNSMPRRRHCEAGLSASVPTPTHHVSDEAWHYQPKAPVAQWPYDGGESGHLSRTGVVGCGGGINHADLSGAMRTNDVLSQLPSVGPNFSKASAPSKARLCQSGVILPPESLARHRVRSVASSSVTLAAKRLKCTGRNAQA